MNEVPIGVVRKFLEDHNANFKRSTGDFEIWMFKSTVIKIPSDSMNIVHFYDMVEYQFDLHQHDFDYWVGENMTIS